MTTPHDITLLLGGVSFLEAPPEPMPPEASLDEGRKERPKTKARQAVDRLLAAVSDGDIQGVRDCVTQCSATGLLPRKLARALVGQGFDRHIAEVLMEHGMLDAKQLENAMKEAEDWSGVGWLCQTGDRIEWLEEHIGDLVTGDRVDGGERNHLAAFINQAMAHPTGREASKMINFAHLVRGLGDDFTLHIVGWSEWMNTLLNRMSDDLPDPGVIRTLDRLFDPHVIRGAWPNDKMEHKQWRAAMAGERLVSWVSYYATTQKLASLETVLTQSDNVRQAWIDYWKISKEQLIKQEMPGVGHLTAQRCEIAHRELMTRLGQHWSRHNDLLDILLERRSDWVVDTLMARGPVTNKLYERLSTGPNYSLGQLVMRLRYSDMDKLLPRLIDRLGKDWRAPNGMGIAHIVLLAWKDPSRAIVQRLLRDPRGHELLLMPDRTGKSALDVIRTHDHWKHEQSYLVQLSRKLLHETATKSTHLPKAIASRRHTP